MLAQFKLHLIQFQAPWFQYPDPFYHIPVAIYGKLGLISAIANVESYCNYGVAG